MEVESAVPISPLPTRNENPATILCHQCGAPIDGTTAVNSLCQDCFKLSSDISDGIPREATLHMCRDCDRWLSPPSQWVSASLESRELLALCLRKLRGLDKKRIIDASFIWTEPHSRRVKVKITIQSEVAQGTILQQTFEVEYVVAHYQCPDCAKSYTHNIWRANVQVRQKVPHKRTFLYLEQVILKYGAHKDTINIKEVDSGIDFFFAQRNQAEKFVDFLSSVAPVRVKKSQTLISMNVHTSAKSYKFSFSVELIPICKDDLVALPLKMAQQAGSIAPLTICYRIGTAVNLIDPNTLQTADITTPLYWRTPFASLADVRELTEFVVMDIEPTGQSKGRFVLADAKVRRATDFGANDDEYTTRTHLGALLHPGDSALGYHLSGTNFNNPEFEAIEENKKHAAQLPDIVLVRKVYPRQRKKNKGRNWKLRRMDRQRAEEEAKSGRGRQNNQDKEETDYEMFLRDVEEDEEMRQGIDLYRASQRQQQQQRQSNQPERMEGVETDPGAAGTGEDQQEDDLENEDEGEDEGEDEDDEGLEIPMDQLQEDFEDMEIAE